MKALLMKALFRMPFRKEAGKKYFGEMSQKPLFTSTIVLIVMLVIVVGLSLPYYLNRFTDFYFQILTEAHGMLFDLAIIGILIFWLNKKAEQKIRISTFKDEIDDFRMWESEEAAFRTVGNIKRLNRAGIHEINLVNCYLPKTNLSHVNLQNSNLNSCNLSNSSLIETDLQGARLNRTMFNSANLNQANLQDAYASGAIFTNSYLIKAHLKGAFLIKADFSDAFLMDADLRGSHLTGANFKNASLYKADLREVQGLTIEQLSEVKTIYLAKFDEDMSQQIRERLPHLLGEGVMA